MSTRTRLALFLVAVGIAALGCIALLLRGTPDRTDIPADGDATLVPSAAAPIVGDLKDLETLSPEIDLDDLSALTAELTVPEIDLDLSF